WQNGWKPRGQAYKWLAETLGIPQQDCHMGLFDVARCKQVILICSELGLTLQHAHAKD
ncbi:zinc-finger-containing protein, partial [Escherichia coli]|uniref:zinc-finger-containing protein n=1 Tax=Escherichia coli TaxID=562 RepID=UPI0034D967C8